MTARGALARDFPPVLARLIPRLGSPFDHEVVATARAIERTVKAQKLDWHDVAAAVTAEAPPIQWDYDPRRHESDWINEGIQLEPNGTWLCKRKGQRSQFVSRNRPCRAGKYSMAECLAKLKVWNMWMMPLHKPTWIDV